MYYGKILKTAVRYQKKYWGDSGPFLIIDSEVATPRLAEDSVSILPIRVREDSPVSLTQQRPR